ncbi:MAG: hypothetical protein KGP35_09935 [Bacteroidetes bacterium]|nr:hypothetical protein [Bacteroidota bacterium]
MPFNPDLASAFFRAGLIETWGRGTLKIIEECKSANIPSPIFQKDVNGITVTFKLKKNNRKSSEKSYRLDKGFNLIPLYQTKLFVNFRHRQSKDCTTRSNDSHLFLKLHLSVKLSFFDNEKCYLT